MLGFELRNTIRPPARLPAHGSGLCHTFGSADCDVTIFEHGWPDSPRAATTSRQCAIDRASPARGLSPRPGTLDPSEITGSSRTSGCDSAADRTPRVRNAYANASSNTPGSASAASA